MIRHHTVTTTTNTLERYKTMFTYVIDIKRDGDLQDSLTTQSLSSAKYWANNNVAEGDLVTISEGIEAIDGSIDTTEHIQSYRIDQIDFL